MAPVDAREVISPEFKKAGHRLYMIPAARRANLMPDTEALTAIFDALHREIAAGRVVAAFALGMGGVNEAFGQDGHRQ